MNSWPLGGASCWPPSHFWLCKGFCCVNLASRPFLAACCWGPSQTISGHLAPFLATYCPNNFWSFRASWLFRSFSDHLETSQTIWPFAILKLRAFFKFSGQSWGGPHESPEAIIKRAFLRKEIAFQMLPFVSDFRTLKGIHTVIFFRFPISGIWQLPRPFLAHLPAS